MTKKISKYLESNWDELKGELKSKWGKLTDDDILKIEGSYDQLIAKLEKAYGNKIENIETEVSEFLTTQGLNAKTTKDASKEVSETVSSLKDMIFGYMDDYFNTLKNKSVSIEKHTAQHIKNNPMKWVGAAAIGGFILAKLIDFRISE